MPAMEHKSMLHELRPLCCAVMTALVMAPICAAQTQQASGGMAGPAVGQGTVLDRIVAIVNDDVILESDIDEERRFESIQPYRGSTAEFSRERAVQRLIDRALILQQSAMEPEDTITDEDLDAQLTKLRKDIPSCAEYHCETDPGWQKYLADRGFTVEAFRERFRNGIHISDDEIKDYYEKTMLPEYARQKVTPPKLETISTRIEEVLLQQQVSNLLRDWLKSLRAQGSVRIMSSDEVAP
jgi:peptidyl-prolyl cis-trans isomerase SurA